MSEKLQTEGLPKFSLVLKSHNQKKRLYEAKEKLLNVYPFEVSEKNIIVSKTEKKNIYDVYISDTEIKNEADILRIVLIIFSVLLLFISAALIVHHAGIKNTEKTRMLKEVERQKLEAEEIKKEKENKLEKITEEYIELENGSYEKIYQFIERIYSVLDAKTTVDNIFIDGFFFTVEVTAKDAVKILSRFEESSGFKSVKMNRSNIKDGSEKVSYSGEFSRFIKEADETLSIDEKIKFYSEAIQLIQVRKNKMCNNHLSEYIKEIRKLLIKNNCREQYIQIREKNKIAEIEFYILSESRNILKFIQEIQQNENSLIDIKSVKINNSGDSRKIHTTLVFSSGIELNHKDDLSEYNDVKIDISAIDKLFYKPAPVKTPEQKTVAAGLSENKKSINLPSANLKKITYIGFTKSGGQTLVLAKDEEMGNICKLVLTEKEITGDYCILKDGNYLAKIRGEYYEVKK